jgi:hypothetical protein
MMLGNEKGTCHINQTFGKVEKNVFIMLQRGKKIK